VWWVWPLTVVLFFAVLFPLQRLTDRLGVLPGPTPGERDLTREQRRMVAGAVARGRDVEDPQLAYAAHVRAVVLRERVERRCARGHRRFQLGLAVVLCSSDFSGWSTARPGPVWRT
jgi:hypothetical protein